MMRRKLLRLATRQRLATAARAQQRCFTVEAAAARTREQAMELCHAPRSIAAIPSDASDEIGDAGASIRPIGCSRRVFLMNAHLTPDEIEGLAYRIKALSTNAAINSVLIATDDDDPRETNALPAMLLDHDKFRDEEDYDSFLFDPKPNKIWHAAGGYDPLEWYKSGHYKDPAAVTSLLDSVQDLALATHGDHWKTRVPIITIPHGAVTDSGYALCLSSYMIATEQTHVHIKNPSRGLTFDPVGFSYMLPRLGHEFNQPSARLKGCGYIMALMGYQATPEDLIETGLATHYMENPTVILGTLERTLADLPSWEQQRYYKTPTKSEAEAQALRYQRPEDFNKTDPHLYGRNAAVADTIDAFTHYGAQPDKFLPYEQGEYEQDMAYLDMDPMSWTLPRRSDLLDFAYTFDGIFQREATVEGILEGFREIAARKTTDPEEQEGIDVAANFVKRLEEAAPLALRVTHKLMKLGEGAGETLASCMAREKSAQAKMMTKPDSDFANWAKAQLSIAASKSTPTWHHRSLADVSEDEVSEIVDATASVTAAT